VQPGAPTPPRIFTVLLVDDEEQVRNVVSRMLQRAGYCVWLAASGSEALSILRTAPVDVVLSDIRMPGMNGLDLAREICRVWPWLRVALMSLDTSVPQPSSLTLACLRSPSLPSRSRVRHCSICSRSLLASTRFPIPRTDTLHLPAIGPLEEALFRVVLLETAPNVRRGESITWIVRSVWDLASRSRALRLECSQAFSCSCESSGPLGHGTYERTPRRFRWHGCGFSCVRRVHRVSRFLGFPTTATAALKPLLWIRVDRSSSAPRH
jgi:hypothetical protein